MSDTFLLTDGKRRFFAKNSSRSPNEPALLVYHPLKRHKEGGFLRCTYVKIPQVTTTYAFFMVKPSWTWGGEMGINEYGVAIGTEAVVTKSQSSQPSLIGQDYLRLALERATSAKEAVTVITELLKIYGQGGNCSFDTTKYRDATYLVADKFETYVLETAGKDFAVKLAEGSVNISGGRLSLDKEWDFTSCGEDEFESRHSRKSFISHSAIRKETVATMLEDLEEVSEERVFKILSSHRNIRGLFRRGDSGAVCMHKSPLGQQTTCSMAVDLSYDDPTIWVTGASAPCLSVFKPYFLGLKGCFVYADTETALSFWLKREYLNRGIYSGLVDKKKHHETVCLIQQEFLDEERRIRQSGGDSKALRDFALNASRKEKEFVGKYNQIIGDIRHGNLKLKGRWKTLNQFINQKPFAKNPKERIGFYVRNKNKK